MQILKRIKTKFDEKNERIAAERIKHVTSGFVVGDAFLGYLISGFDFHSVLEGYPDVILAINRDEINEALELDGVECCHKVFLFAKRSQKLPDGRAGESCSRQWERR